MGKHVKCQHRCPLMYSMTVLIEDSVLMMQFIGCLVWDLNSNKNVEQTQADPISKVNRKSKIKNFLKQNPVENESLQLISF